MLILFDCDGVLVDSEVLATRELQRYLEDLSFPTAFEVENHDRFTGLSLRDIRTSLETQAGRSLPEDFERELRRRDMKAFQRDLRRLKLGLISEGQFDFQQTLLASVVTSQASGLFLNGDT